MTRLTVLALTVAGVVVAGGSTLAHHAWPVDRSREVTVTGTVVEYMWGNPHVMIALDVKGDDGTVVRWNVGGPSTGRMERNGWDRATLGPGEVITGTGYQFRDGQRVVQLDRIVRADGREMLLYGRP